VRTQLFFCGKAGPRAPRCPLKLTEQAGPNGPESHAVASPWGDLGIHTCGPPYCQADKSSNKHSHANDPQSIRISASKDKATCPIRVTPCQRRRSVPRWRTYRPVPRPGIALCDIAPFSAWTVPGQTRQAPDRRCGTPLAMRARAGALL